MIRVMKSYDRGLLISKSLWLSWNSSQTASRRRLGVHLIRSQKLWMINWRHMGFLRKYNLRFRMLSASLVSLIKLLELFRQVSNVSKRGKPCKTFQRFPKQIKMKVFNQRNCSKQFKTLMDCNRSLIILSPGTIMNMSSQLRSTKKILSFKASRWVNNYKKLRIR